MNTDLKITECLQQHQKFLNKAMHFVKTNKPIQAEQFFNLAAAQLTKIVEMLKEQRN
jgi:hypothetical protein